ncbi:unnamed protein product [Brachionus calyciflorus]|uniref:EF-hand domain-containing protein n=1 Tax=Brachionus calyciflorus TaxID=104777 RepID=A0A813RW28_9BILA|nr:unnamed protein product [Brachionus calyciflorus]
MSNLTRTQEKELKEAFDIFDRDHSGSISARELKAVFKNLEISASDQDIKNAMKQMDINNDGEISFSEFSRVMEAQFYRKYTHEEIRAAFDHFDKDKSGYISADELRMTLSKMGKTFRKDEVDKMIKSIDKDGDGRISINEFMDLLN